MALSVVLAGGGTAGHVEPALAVAAALRRHDPACRLTLLGAEGGLEERLVPERGFDLRLIPRVPLPRRLSLDVARLPGRVAGAVAAAGHVIDDVEADVVVGFGGYVAFPAYVAARRRRIPIVVHEANARPGVANRVGARFAHRVAVGFPGTPLRRAEIVGLPLRPQIATLDRAARRHEAARALGLDPARVTVLAFGGSQGAATLNATVPVAASAIAHAGGQVLLATGRGREDEARGNASAGIVEAGRLVLREYLDRMDDAYAAADVVVCRAGAMTVAEVTAVGLPAVFVPLPIGNGEQRLNAAPVVAAGGALVLDDSDCTPESLQHLVLPLVDDEAARTLMGRRAAEFGRLDADEAVATMVRDVAARAADEGESRR